MPGFPSGFNTFVPSFDASGKLVVAYSRNPKDFPLNRWITLTPVKKSQGYFLQVTAEEAARIINGDLADFVWPDGNDAPSGQWGDESFNFQPFNTTRYLFGFRIGYKAEQQADWKILALYAAFKAQQAMTARAVRAITAALNQSNYAASHVQTATALGGGFWSTGTTSNPIVKKCMNAMAQQIQLDTNGAVKREDLRMVISPVVAAAVASSSEIQDYVKNSVYAMPQVRGDVASNNGLWGLPDKLYGYELIVDDTVRVTSRKGAAARAAGYVFDGNTAFMCARPGQLVSEAAGPSFGTVHLFSYEEMTVEQRDDPDHRRIAGRVIDDYDVEVVAPATGAIITHVLS
jgi:hypothetical protein